LGTAFNGALINGGSGADTITANFISHIPRNTFNDIQLTRVGLASSSADTLNGFSTSVDVNGAGGNTYFFGAEFTRNQITQVFAHANDIVDASIAGLGLNFVFGNLRDFRDADIIGTAQNDTLTLNIDVPDANAYNIIDTDFTDKSAVEALVLNSVDPANVGHAFFNVVPGGDAEDTGISTVVGGNGGDRIDASGMTTAVTLSGGLNVRLASDNQTSLTILQDTLIGGTVADSLYGDNFYDLLEGNDGADTLNGTSDSALGANEIDTLTGGLSADVFILGDASNAYYNTASGRGDYAIITDFSAGDIIQLKNVSSLYTPTTPITASATYNFGYVEGTANIFNVSVAGVAVDRFIYADADKDGVISSGDNLIAAVDSGVGALDLTNTTRFNFV
jgi:hypothetical protein